MAHETILVIDADPKSQKVLEVSFKKTGYRVIMVQSQREALERLAAELPDLIITDTILPDGDGFSLCADLKADARYKDIPLVFLTEDDALTSKMRGFELGASDYLTKPIYIKEVTSRVETLLHKRAKDMISAEDGEQVEGSLEDVTMIDLLQTIESEQRSGTIHLQRGSNLASVHFKDGNIMDALCGKLHGEEAIYRLMLWPKGHFTIRYHDLGKRADHIDKDATALLIEGIQRLERWTDMVATLPNLQSVFEADYERLPTILRDMPKEVGQVVRLFDGQRTLRDVIDNSPVDDLLTLRIIRKLLDDASLVDVTPDQSELTATGQHTNLAAWLAEQTRTIPPASKPHSPGAQVASTATPTIKPDRPLFTTAHGQQQVPSLNSATVPDPEPSSLDVQQLIASPALNPPAQAPDRSDAQLAAAAPAQTPELAPAQAPATPIQAALAPTAPAPAASAPATEPDLEEGRAPDLADRSWRFHWDATTQQAVAVPREPAAPEAAPDPFALNDLARDLELLERRRQEEEARRIAADRQAAELASGMFASVAQQVLAQRAQAAQEAQEASLPEADDAVSYVSKDDTKELHRNAILAELEERKRQEEARERTPTPLAMPVQPLRQDPEPRAGFDPLDDVRDMLPPEANRVASVATAEDVKREAQAHVRAAEDDEDSWRPGRQRTDQFITVSRDEPPTNAPTSAQDLVPLGSPADAISEPEVSEDDVAHLKAKSEASDYDLEEISPAPSQTSAEEVLTDDDEDEDEDEDEEDDDVEDDSPAPAREAEKSSASKLAQRTALNRELVHTEYELRDAEPPAAQDQEDDEDDEDDEDEDDEDKRQDKGQDKGDEDQDDPQAEVETIDERRDASRVEDASKDDSKDAPTAQADESAQAPKVEPDAKADKPSAMPPLEDRFEDLEPSSAESFNTKGLLVVAGVIVACLLAFYAVYKMQETPSTPPGQDPALIANANNAKQPIQIPPPDMAAPKASPDQGAAQGSTDQGLTDQGATDLSQAASDMPADAAALTDLGAAAVSASDMGGADQSRLADMKAADSGAAVAALDMGGAAKTPDMGQGASVTPPGDKPDTTSPAPQTFEQRLADAEDQVKRNRWAAARKLLKALAQEDASNGKVASLLGSCEYNMGNDDAALRELNKAVRLGYSSEQLYLDLASVYIAKQNNAQAINAYNQFLKAFPNSKDASKVRSYRDKLK